MKNILPTVKKWAARDPRLTLIVLDESHTNHADYPDEFRTIRLEMILEAPRRRRRPYLYIWLPLIRRTPTFEFGGDTVLDDDGERLYASADVEANFPSFDNARELTAALDRILADFLRRYATKPRKRRS